MACIGNVDPARAFDRPKPSVVLVVHESLSGVLMDTSRGRGQMPFYHQACIVMACIVMAYIVMAYIVMACIVMACIVMADIVMADIVMAYVVMAYVVMTNIVMAYIVMPYIVMAHIVMAYIVMAYIVRYHPPCTARRWPARGRDLAFRARQPG